MCSENVIFSEAQETSVTTYRVENLIDFYFKTKYADVLGLRHLVFQSKLIVIVAILSEKFRTVLIDKKSTKRNEL